MTARPQLTAPTRALFALTAFMLIAPSAGFAQDDASDAPQLKVTFEKDEAIPGQPLSLRLTVLVPTFMPAPPVWPSLEAPNLLVRLPERSTGPVSEKIGGATWSGVSRHFRISPMVPGDFAIPPQDVTVTYADPQSNEPIKATLTTEPIAFKGVLPEGAEGLDPFVAANALKLSQEMEGEPGAMVPGDSVVRTVTARVDGVSPMFLPKLIEDAAVEGVAAYADQPAIEESDERGILKGTRTERVTYLAEGGGSGEIPAVRVDWYNLKTGKVETASADGFAIEIDGPPATRAQEPAASLNWRLAAVSVVAAALALALLALFVRTLLPALLRWARDARARYRASEAYAFAAVQAAVARQDHAALRPALDQWAGLVAGPDPRQDPAVQAALTGLGAVRYGKSPLEQDEAAAWRALSDAVTSAKRGGTHRKHDVLLPPLNPGAS